MNFSATNKIEKEIIELPQNEVKERIKLAKSDAERAFWFSLQDRALQAKQEKEIKRKQFIR